MPKLTDRLLNALSVGDGRKDRIVFDTEVPGLGVRIPAKGTRTFIAQWTDPATRRKVREPLGSWGNLTIGQARDAVKVRLGQVARGISPRAERLHAKAEDERRRAEAALTFEALIDDWDELHVVNRRKRYRDEAKRAAKLAFRELLKRPAAGVTRADAINILDRLVKSGKAVTAARSLAYARAAFNWAVKREKIPKNPLVGLPIATIASERERVLNDGELAEIWVATQPMPYPWGPFFRIAILTLQRREEVAAMRWSGIAPDFDVWSIPGTRMKNGKPHDVHLAQAARTELRTLAELRDKDCDFVFTTTSKTSVSGFSRAPPVPM
jgi:integrase